MPFSWKTRHVKIKMNNGRILLKCFGYWFCCMLAHCPTVVAYWGSYRTESWFELLVTYVLLTSENVWCLMKLMLHGYTIHAVRKDPLFSFSSSSVLREFCGGKSPGPHRHKHTTERTNDTLPQIIFSSAAWPTVIGHNCHRFLKGWKTMGGLCEQFTSSSPGLLMLLFFNEDTELYQFSNPDLKGFCSWFVEKTFLIWTAR